MNAFDINAFLNRFRTPIRGRHERKKVVLDNLTVRGAEFVECTVLYGGGKIDINGATFDNCKFKFYGAAGNTLSFLKHMDKHSADLIANTFVGAILHDRKGALA